jgi:pyruvate,water dikinase
MANNSYILNFADIQPEHQARVGGKCYSLGDMINAGVPVPGGFAVTTDAYEAMLNHNGLRTEVQHLLDSLKMDDVADQERVASAIQVRFRSHPLPAEVEQAIREAYSAMGDDMAVAVRSSATAEDLPDASFAGQQDTYLWVQSADDVVEKVRDCWASLFTARAIAYRDKNQLGQIEVLMSVGVQKMVNARSAGVAMSINPLNGDRTKIVIDSSWGLGELVVSGVVTPDNYTVEKVLLEIIDRQISDKHVELLGDANARCTIEKEVDQDRRLAASITDEEVVTIAKLAKQLEKQKGCPQDIEWAIDADLPAGENLVALQSRPETVWSQKAVEKPKQTYATGLMGIVGALNNPLANKAS